MTSENALIREHYLLRGVSEEEAELILRDGYDVYFSPGEVVFREGEEAQGLYLIASGTIRLSATGPNGETIIATVGAGDVLGELGVLDGERRSARAIAIGMCCAFFVPAEPFLDILESSPAVCLRLMAMLTKRLRYANGRLGEVAAMNVEQEPSLA